MFLKTLLKIVKIRFFHTFEYRCECDIQTEQKTSDKVFHWTISNISKPFSSQTEKLRKELTNTKKCFTTSLN